jgi:large subunit ribosomal protein L3
VEEKMSESSTAVQLPTFFGVKAGMTRIFDESGTHVPVTVVKLIPNLVSQVKTKAKEGYNAYQVAYFEKRESLVTNPKKGILKKAKIDMPLTKFSEVKFEDVKPELVGAKVGYEDFPASTFVDVCGVSKGKGFQGVMKRHNFAGGPGAHGSTFHRHGGSIGCRNIPGKVFKKMKMPGHMGDVNVTVQNTKVVAVNLEKGYMLLKGSVPGSKNGILKISKAIKKQ